MTDSDSTLQLRWRADDAAVLVFAEDGSRCELFSFDTGSV